MRVVFTDEGTAIYYSGVMVKLQLSVLAIGHLRNVFFINILSENVFILKVQEGYILFFL